MAKDPMGVDFFSGGPGWKERSFKGKLKALWSNLKGELPEAPPPKKKKSFKKALRRR